jgi:hypothetical protein
MQGIPAQLDKHFILEDFRNGQALVLERRLT